MASFPFLKHKSKCNTYKPERQRLVFIKTSFICATQNELCYRLLHQCVKLKSINPQLCSLLCMNVKLVL